MGLAADVTPIFFMWEKLIGTHEKSNWIRLPSRLPVGETSLYLVYASTFLICMSALSGRTCHSLQIFRLDVRAAMDLSWNCIVQCAQHGGCA